MDHNSPEAIAKRKAQNAKHRPWDRWTQAEKDMHMRIQGARPIQWTTDPSLAGQVTEDGYVWAFAGGPVEGSPQATVKKRADGKVDGRSKGVRKCGRCGETGHNARTCGRPRRSGPASLPKSLRKPVQSAPEAPTPSPTVEPSEAVQTPSGEAPKPKSLAARDQARNEVRAAKKGKRVCGKCGQPGHNARTCGKSGKVRHAKAPGKTGRQNTCGKCGGKGHNARTCRA